jgi:hypothetical protein
MPAPLTIKDLINAKIVSPEAQKQILGLGGRRLDAEQWPSHLNTPKSVARIVQMFDYGQFNRAIKDITSGFRQGKTAIISNSVPTAPTVAAAKDYQKLTQSLGTALTGSFTGNIGNMIKGLQPKEVLDVFKGMMDELNETVKSLIHEQGFDPEETKAIAEGVRKGITEEFSKFFKSEEGKNAVKGIIKPAEEERTSYAKKAWDSIKHHVVHGFFGTLQEVKEEIVSDWEELKDEIRSEWEEVLGPKIHALIDGIKKTFKTVLEWLSPIGKWFNEKVLKKFFSTLKFFRTSGTLAEGGGLLEGVKDVAKTGAAAAGGAGGAIVGGKIAAGTLGAGTLGTVGTGAGVAGTLGLIGIASHLMYKDLVKAFSGPEMKKSWDNLSKSIGDSFKKSMDFFWGFGSDIYKFLEGIYEKAAGIIKDVLGGEKAQKYGADAFGALYPGGTTRQETEDVLKQVTKSAIEGLGAISSCGDQVAKVLNPAIREAGGATYLPEGGLGADQPERLSKAYGTKLIKQRETPFTAEEMGKMSVGTFMVTNEYNKQTGKYDGHAQSVQRNPDNPKQKGILTWTGTKSKWITFEEAEQNIKNAGYKNYMATNPFESKQLGAKTPEWTPLPQLPQAWEQKIDEESKKAGISPNLARAVLSVESRGIRTAKSGKGAMGLMQLMPGTAAKLGVKDPWNPEENIAGGIKLLGQLDKQYKGDAEKILWAYNAGPKRVEQGVKPEETQKYIPAVMAKYRELEGIGPAAQIAQAEREKVKSQANIQKEHLNVQKKVSDTMEDMGKDFKESGLPRGEGATNIIAPQNNMQQMASGQDPFSMAGDWFAQLISLSLSAMTA